MATERKETDPMIIRKSNIFILKYADTYSVENSSIRDYEIGTENHLVGCNKSNIGKNKLGFILVNNEEGKQMVGFVGTIGNRVEDQQPWRDNGGREWKYIHSVKFHSKLIDLDLLCNQLEIEKQIFTKSIQFGHVRSAYIDQFNRVLNFFAQL